MTKKFKVSVVGASGNVGREMINVLSDRKFPVSELVPIASARSAGKEVKFGSQRLVVQDLARYDFSGTDIALFSPGSAVSKEYAPKAAEAGCVVVDNTSYFRMDPDVPLVVPEVNPESVAGYAKKGIIANPNCSTTQMLVPLKKLHDQFDIKRIVVSTYQSVSGAGKEAMDELYGQTKRYFEVGRGPASPAVFTKEISFNCIPHIDVFMEDGRAKEEWKMEVETKKILGESVQVCATCVRVPVFTGHAESINIQFNKSYGSLIDIYDILSETEGVVVMDRHENGGYMTQRECVRTFPVYISRLREDPTASNCINMWNVADNVYGKGAALNSVQIAEILADKYL